MTGSTVCPHCGTIMDPIETPLDSSWGGEIHYICFNDECRYYVNSWQAMERQGIEGAGYRCRIDSRGTRGPVAVQSCHDLRECIVRCAPEVKGTLDYFSATHFARDDETPDAAFYQSSSIDSDLDSLAATTVEDLFVDLIQKGARVLDLMAGSVSFLRDEIAATVIGIGQDEKALQENPALRERIVHDMNADPCLPFHDNEFHAVVSAISVDYMTRPVEIFREVSRVLKPNGVFVVVFSNRMFPPKAVNIWKTSTETERIDLVKQYFSHAERFYLDGYFESKGKPRPKDDKLYSLGIPSDPIYAVWGRVVK